MAKSATIQKPGASGESGFLKRICSSWQLYVLMLPALAWLAIFAYYPLYGLLIAFKDYRARVGIGASPWADPIFKHFIDFFSTSIAGTVIWNTIALSLLTILFSFPIPIIFALLLNQIKSDGARKTIQTISYAPYFMSNVVVVSMIAVLFAPSGFVNNIITALGGNIVYFTDKAECFRPVYVTSQIWQTMGFNAIIYIAALAGISPDYYEAAIIDGATKFKRILYIDIPLIMPTIILMFILALGSIMSVGYEKVFLLQNSGNTAVSEIISTYVYKTGLQTAQYSFATAVGLFNSAVNFIILILANTITKKLSNISIF